MENNVITLSYLKWYITILGRYLLLFVWLSEEYFTVQILFSQKVKYTIFLHWYICYDYQNKQLYLPTVFLSQKIRLTLDIVLTINFLFVVWWKRLHNLWYLWAVTMGFVSGIQDNDLHSIWETCLLAE